MNSINKNQPEDNIENLNTEKAKEKIKELADKKVCFLNTDVTSGESAGVRPMSVQKIDDTGNLWFLIAEESHTNKEIAASSNVKLFFQGSAHSDFLFIKGNASITKDKQVIKELWEPILKTWFTEGENDPRITAVQVTPSSGYYWDTKHGNAVAGAKILIGAAMGKTLDDSIEGKINL